MHPIIQTAKPILSILSYAPIALFAESLRLPKALCKIIVLPNNACPCLTGSVKDLGRLWNIDPISLFGSPQDTANAAVASIRHGNSFPLANTTLLQSLGIVGRRLDRDIVGVTTDPSTARETIINLYLMTPPAQGPLTTDQPSYRPAKVLLIVALLLELAAMAGAFVGFFLHQLPIGCILMACPAVNIAIVGLLRYFVKPTFGNKHAIRTDLNNGVAKGAALDVHVIAPNWNSSELDVFCGFSSHLHSLTNIPVGVTSPKLLKNCCRVLVLVLIVQAATLASSLGKQNEDWISSLAWLALYICMAAIDHVLDRAFRSQNRSKYLAEVCEVGCLKFSSRRSALTFLSMLPVTHKGDKWAWLHVFMPDDERRRSWQRELETCPDVSEEETTRPDQAISLGSRANIAEAQGAGQNLVVTSCVEEYAKTLKYQRRSAGPSRS